MQAPSQINNEKSFRTNEACKSQRESFLERCGLLLQHYKELSITTVKRLLEN